MPSTDLRPFTFQETNLICNPPSSNRIAIIITYIYRIIDLYLKAVDDNNKILFGKFIEKITVLDVRDGTGRPVFDAQPPRTPAELLFAVPDDMYELLSKATYINNITIVPVPRNKNYSKLPGELKTYEFLKNFILAKSAVIPEE